MNDFIYLIQNALFTIVHPSFWYMSYDYSRIWDKKLIESMKYHKFKNIGKFHADLGVHAELWIKNHPYCSFSVKYGIFPFEEKQYRPSRLTIYNAMEKLKKDYLEENAQNP